MCQEQKYNRRRWGQGGEHSTQPSTVRGRHHPERPFRMTWVCVGRKVRKSKVKEIDFLLVPKLEEGMRRKVKVVAGTTHRAEGEQGFLVPPHPTPSAPPSDSVCPPHVQLTRSKAQTWLVGLLVVVQLLSLI